MFTRSMLALCFALVTAIAACGGDRTYAPDSVPIPSGPNPTPGPTTKTACDKLEALSPTDKAGSCDIKVTFDFVNCSTVYAACDAKGKGSIDNAADCFAYLPPCQKGQESNFIVGFQQCSMLLQAAGPYCK